jgi:hypothetical protein
LALHDVSDMTARANIAAVLSDDDEGGPRLPPPPPPPPPLCSVAPPTPSAPPPGHPDAEAWAAAAAVSGTLPECGVDIRSLDQLLLPVAVLGEGAGGGSTALVVVGAKGKGGAHRVGRSGDEKRGGSGKQGKRSSHRSSSRRSKASSSKRKKGGGKRAPVLAIEDAATARQRALAEFASLGACACLPCQVSAHPTTHPTCRGVALMKGRWLACGGAGKPQSKSKSKRTAKGDSSSSSSSSSDDDDDDDDGSLFGGVLSSSSEAPSEAMFGAVSDDDDGDSDGGMAALDTLSLGSLSEDDGPASAASRTRKKGAPEKKAKHKSKGKNGKARGGEVPDAASSIVARTGC